MVATILAYFFVIVQLADNTKNCEADTLQVGNSTSTMGFLNKEKQFSKIEIKNGSFPESTLTTTQERTY